MDVRQFLGGKHLSKEDVPQPVLVTIKDAATETFEQEDKGARKKVVLYFNELDKGLVLNAGNSNILANAFGSWDTDNWIGRKMVIYTDNNVMFAGKRVGGLVVRMPKANPVPGQLRSRPNVPPPPEADGPGFNDEPNW